MSVHFELTKEFVIELKEALSSKAEKQILELVTDLHSADIAEVVSELDSNESKVLFSMLDAVRASEVLMNMEDDDRKDHLKLFTPQEIAEVFLENLETDDAVDVVQDLEEEQREEVISNLEDEDQASDIVDLLGFEEGTAGALMGKEMIKVNENWTVKECVRQMRKQAETIENIYTVYVIDDIGRFLGRLSLKKLLLSDTRAKIKDLFQAGLKTSKTYTSSEEVAQIMEKYDLVALPVLDEMGRLVGRITIDDVVDVIKEEAEKDYQLASGISSNVEPTDNLFVLTKARLPWLVLGLIGGVFGSLVIGNYEHELNIYPEMAFFIPLIAAMGGNVGVQSSAIIVQGLANNSLGIEGMFGKLKKEFSVAFLNGLICSGLIFCYNLIVSDSMNLSYTVSLALFVVILFAGLFGTFIPLLLDKYKIDPALATGPFITTVNDILGLLIYFMIGRAMYL